MSYGFSMGFAQAKDLSEAMNLALEYVGMRMEPKRVTEELKRNIYYVPTIRARYACNKNVPYSQRNMQLENLADMADRYWVKNLFSYRFLYWEKQRLLGIVMMKDEDLSDKWPLCVYFQNSTDQNYPYGDWEVGNIPFFTDAVSKAKPLRAAIEACELQIPKQPISKSWSPNLCPHCEADLGGVCNDGYYENPRYERCPVCGQRLTYENQ